MLTMILVKPFTITTTRSSIYSQRPDTLSSYFGLEKVFTMSYY